VTGRPPEVQRFPNNVSTRNHPVGAVGATEPFAIHLEGVGEVGARSFPRSSAVVRVVGRIFVGVGQGASSKELDRHQRPLRHAGEGARLAFAVVPDSLAVVFRAGVVDVVGRGDAVPGPVPSREGQQLARAGDLHRWRSRRRRGRRRRSSRRRSSRRGWRRGRWPGEEWQSGRASGYPIDSVLDNAPRIRSG